MLQEWLEKFTSIMELQEACRIVYAKIQIMELFFSSGAAVPSDKVWQRGPVR